MSPRPAVARLFAAIESRDLRAIADALTPDATWQNVPHPPERGRDAVLALLAPIVTWSQAVRWNVVSAGYADDTGWVERVDRFVVDDVEHAVRCLGVFTVRDGRVAVVRDYVDLGEWRARIAPVLERRAGTPPSAVVARHLAAVVSGDAVAMTADYALDAVLVRGATTYEGWAAIADYFTAVPVRLGGRAVRFGVPVPGAGGSVAVSWSIGTAAAGRDRYDVAAGRIVRQTVELDGDDF